MPVETGAGGLPRGTTIHSSKLYIGVGTGLLQCNMGRSAIWEMIPITQKANVKIDERNARSRPGADADRFDEVKMLGRDGSYLIFL
jgi:hypothetical protein